MADKALNLIARRAGKYPDAMPIKVAKNKVAKQSHKGIDDIISLPCCDATTLTNFDAPILNKIPTAPPANPINAAYVKNNFLISAKEAPITFITPISLVRS